MLGHVAGIGYTGLGPWMGPIDNFSLVTGLHECTVATQPWEALIIVLGERVLQYSVHVRRN